MFRPMSKYVKFSDIAVKSDGTALIVHFTAPMPTKGMVFQPHVSHVIVYGDGTSDKNDNSVFSISQSDKKRRMVCMGNTVEVVIPITRYDIKSVKITYNLARRGIRQGFVPLKTPGITFEIPTELIVNAIQTYQASLTPSDKSQGQTTIPVNQSDTSSSGSLQPETPTQPITPTPSKPIVTLPVQPSLPIVTEPTTPIIPPPIISPQPPEQPIKPIAPQPIGGYTTLPYNPPPLSEVDLLRIGDGRGKKTSGQTEI